jgi:hypothetical protein
VSFPPTYITQDCKLIIPLIFLPHGHLIFLLVTLSQIKKYFFKTSKCLKLSSIFQEYIHYIILTLCSHDKFLQKLICVSSYILLSPSFILHTSLYTKKNSVPILIPWIHYCVSSIYIKQNFFYFAFAAIFI